jgi:hypothetical protein
MALESRNIVPSRNSMKEGQTVIAKDPKKGFTIFVKQGSELYSIPLGSSNKGGVFDNVTINGSANINNKLIANTIESRNLSYTKFIDYRPFPHNFSENLTTAARYLPWEGPADDTTMDDARRAYLAPFKMTLHRILFRPETISDSGADITFGLVKQIDGSTERKTIATTTYTNTISSNTYNIINQSDFLINAPFDDLSIEVGEKVGIYIEPESDPAGAIDWYITSVWKTEVDLS